MITIPRASWKHFGKTVMVRCLSCSLVAMLDHEIADDGTVNPSLDCPQCDFHDFVKLDEYVPTQELP